MKKKIIKICIVFGLVVALIGIPNIPADYPEYINNLNATFVSNADELVEVQMNRWVGDELNATIENWTLAELNEFLEDIELVTGTFPDLQFIPGSRSASETFTVMVSYGFIANNSEDLEAYYTAYPGYLEDTASTTQIFTAMQQKSFIPEGKNIIDLEEFLEDKYEEYEEDIEDWLEENCDDLDWETSKDYETCFVRGEIGGNILYAKWPIPAKGAIIVQCLRSTNGCNLEIILAPDFHAPFKDSDNMVMINTIWIGGFVLPIHWGPNLFKRDCFAWTHATSLFDCE